MSAGPIVTSHSAPCVDRPSRDVVVGRAEAWLHADEDGA
jgi:hypothetical protein